MEQILADAKTLAQRLKYHDSAADSLINDATNLQTKLQAMKEYREEVSKLNEVAKHRPRSTLILGSQLENQRIRDLENENRELHLALADHQSTLELIMNKYREQVLNLLTNKRLDSAAIEHINRNSGDLSVLKEKVNEMATVMHKAVKADEEFEHNDAEMMAKLKCENKTLRELLNISGHPKKEIEKLKQMKRVEEEDFLMNGDATSSEERSIDSSADEMDGRMDTVKRKGKTGGAETGVNSANTDSVGTGVRRSVGENSTAVGDDYSNDNLNGSGYEDHEGAFADSKREDILNENESYEDGKWEIKPDRLILGDVPVVESGSDEKPKQEDLLDLYNSEGILVEDGEDNLSKRKSLGHDSKISGIKFRRSTKQKKVIQADLKSYFQINEGATGELDRERNIEDDKGDGSNKGNGVVEADSYECEEERDLRDYDEEQETISRDESKTAPFDADGHIFYNPKLNREFTDAIRMAKLGLDLTGKRIVNIDYNFTPPESPTDSSDIPGRKGGMHRTLQLDYSDSDSDDAELMVEDQFGDIDDGCDSSSSSDNNDDAVDDEVDVTEEDLIGKLDEGGEFVLSTWTRPMDRCEHLDEEEKELVPEEAAIRDDVAGRSETQLDVGSTGSEFAFTEAYLQEDQFTGGSIEAKFAKRKRYKDGSMASAVTLFSGTDSRESPRGSIRSDSDLTVENENTRADIDESVGDERVEDEARQAPSITDLSAEIASSPSGSNTPPLSSNSSSGEIDPTVFMKKLSGGSSRRFHTKTASDLTNLLNELDAQLLQEDKDID